MQIPTVGFLASYARLDQLPSYSFPEVAFAGRSNVGKSSLINALVFQRALAQVSSTPGRTRTINIYPVNGEWMLVDLPGYGYAKVSKQQRTQFRQLLMGYLLERPQLALACLLVDSRHDPTADDCALIEELELHHRTYAVILTKADALSPAAVDERHHQLRHLVQHCTGCVDVLVTSARTGLGRTQLWGCIRRTLAQYHHRRTST
ncbi:MAG: putative GTP-binding protein EngB [Candidatus Kapaibacterium sp.]|nr:MAG: putative GTP-binding protein EngB [Candidatus Kapabacteria bacterium]